MGHTVLQLYITLRHFWENGHKSVRFGKVCLNVNDFLCLTPVLEPEDMHLNFLRHTHTGVRFNFFCERVINPWNNLPSNTDFRSISAFNRSITNSYLANYLKRY